ncbi:ABC transporter permease [Chengkuizengella axinellae]|uniref:ABC-2 family transporter protein n=1 Tax=Chengkuizengella axinellae TaxID=3064388 RepID=A0ABT9J0I9_9BACL|nr:ABC-2 family transporter protein [Chengkuizengella sp. 2205SS18-9]MDP5274922.1 ABC-2 family transporter protein [Chengkuizengella sp. 2205SS18-9]
MEMRMYFMLIRASIKSRLQYKFNFIFSMLMAMLLNVSEFLMIAFVLLKFNSIQGWSIYEVGYLYSVILLSKTLYRTFASDVHHLEKYLVSGDLDSFFIRPIPILLTLMSQNFFLLIGELLQGTFIILICIQHFHSIGQVDLWIIPITILIILAGSIILFSIGLATSTLGFWLTRVEMLQNLTEDAAMNAVRYPLSLYPNWLKGIFLTILPLGFINYLPALYILKQDVGIWIIGATIMVACLCLWLSLRFWKIGLSRYQSTGS